MQTIYEGAQKWFFRFDGGTEFILTEEELMEIVKKAENILKEKEKEEINGSTVFQIKKKE